MEDIIKILKKIKKPASLNEITRRLNVHPREKVYVKKMLDRLVRDGRIVKSDGLYNLPENEGLLEGTVCSTVSGADFFVCEGMEDMKIVHSREYAVMHNDRVLVKKTGRNVRIVKVLERSIKRIVGTVYKDGTTYYLAPDDKKLHELFIIPKGKRGDAAAGDKAVCDIITYPFVNANGTCIVRECLGSAEDDDTAILSVLYKYDVRQKFSEAVLLEAENAPDTVAEEELSGRLDLRKLNIITIDGDDAKDLDDAISLEITEKGDYLLGVHIADVSHYVKMDSAVDVEARERATSVYIPGTVYPMLPQKLSNGICSLNENVNRLTLSCFMIITKQGKMTEYSIQPSVIRSKHRMTYSEVTELLENSKSEMRKQYKDVFGMILLMRQLAQILIDTANKRGSIDFDLPEAKIILDENGFPSEIKRYETGISNKIIEQFMLQANTTVAKHMQEKVLPAVYRVHEEPEQKKLEAFADLIATFNLRLPEKPTPKDFQEILAKVAGAPEEALIKKTMLRSMSKAKYKPSCQGHFGLAYDHYLHFTSPIRRYPDLFVHRTLNMVFDNNMNALKEQSARLENAANVSTQREIDAAMCERDVDDIRKAQYMSQRIGEEFEGAVSGVTAYGMFVELENTVEGFIPVNTMEGYYDYDEANYRLVSDKNIYRLGDRVKIRVFAVNVADGKVEFTLLA